MLDDAADTAIRDMERSGVDIITDGEVRRLDGYVDSYYAIIQGIEPTQPGRKLGPWGYDQQTRYRAVGKVRVPDAGLGIIDEFKYAREHTGKRLKATCAGPLTFASRILPNGVYSNVVEIAEEFAHLINAELKGLVAAGADFVQLDDPVRGNVSGQEMARLYNLATEGVNAKLAFHLCFGNRFGRGRFQRTYTQCFPGVLDARADQFVLEFASRELSEIELWPGWAQDRELGAGLIDVKSFYPESPEDVARRIRRVLKHVRPEKLYINPDCGFGWSPRAMCNQKLGSMVAGARIVRDELAGTSTAKSD
jgi:5-methyltetrahydropteroyltriglutamate--homocysteine methyltransferase